MLILVIFFLEVLLIDVVLREVCIGVVVRGRNMVGFVSFLGVGGGFGVVWVNLGFDVILCW